MARPIPLTRSWILLPPQIRHPRLIRSRPANVGRLVPPIRAFQTSSRASVGEQRENPASATNLLDPWAELADPRPVQPRTPTPERSRFSVTPPSQQQPPAKGPQSKLPVRSTQRISELPLYDAFDSLNTLRPSPSSSQQQRITFANLDGARRSVPSRALELPKQRQPARMKLGASAGRKTYLTQATDIAGAIRAVNILCTTNDVRRDANRQRFHERRGLERKRLKSERWRRGFAAAFRAVVVKVKKLRAKGW